MTHVVQTVRLQIPPRTQLQAVFYMPSTGQWYVYTACKDRNAAFEDMLGTALVLQSDGSASRWTARPDDMDDLFDIMPPHAERKDNE